MHWQSKEKSTQEKALERKLLAQHGMGAVDSIADIKDI